MYNCFEHPWLGLVAAFIGLVAVYLFRSSFPEKRKWWQLLLPVMIVVGAFGLDHFVKTDPEKINNVIETGLQATINKDIKAIDPLFAANYSDRFHPRKDAIMGTVKYLLAGHNFERAVMTYHDILVEGKNATADVLIRVHLNEYGSDIPAPSIVYAKLRLIFSKKPDSLWAIKSTDLVEINKRPVNWNRVR